MEVADLWDTQKFTLIWMMGKYTAVSIADFDMFTNQTTTAKNIDYSTLYLVDNHV